MLLEACNVHNEVGGDVVVEYVATFWYGKSRLDVYPSDRSPWGPSITRGGRRPFVVHCYPFPLIPVSGTIGIN